MSGHAGGKIKRVVAATAGACAAAALLAAAAPAAASTPTPGWPSINFSNANTSDDSTETVLNSGTIATLHPVQHGDFNAGGGSGSMVISGGRLFTTCAGVGQDQIGICAWSQSSLQLLWQTSVPGGDPGETNVTAAGGELFVHADDFTYEALNQATGARVWQLSDADPELSTYVPPPIITGSVEAYFDNAGRVVERSTTTGKQLLREAPTDLPATSANDALLAEMAGDVVVGQTVYSFADSGVAATPLTCAQRPCAPLWTVAAPQYAQHIVYADGRLFLGGTGGIYALNATTGATEFVLESPEDDELSGGVELTEVADDVIITSIGTSMYAWKESGCGAAACLPVWQVEPSGVAGVNGVFVEAGGKLYTPGGWVYAVDSVQHSPYGPAAAPTKVAVSNSHDSTCDTAITWTPPTQTGGLPLTASTVTLSNGENRQSWTGGDNFYFLPKGNYTATVADDTPWGPGATATTTFRVPACT